MIKELLNHFRCSPRGVSFAGIYDLRKCPEILLSHLSLSLCPASSYRIAIVVFVEPRLPVFNQLGSYYDISYLLISSAPTVVVGSMQPVWAPLVDTVTVNAVNCQPSLDFIQAVALRISHGLPW